MKIKLILIVASLLLSSNALSDADYNKALKRAQYLFNQTVPTDAQLSQDAASQDRYHSAVRGFLDHENFYDAMMRYHETIYGTGLQSDYMEELLNDSLDGKTEKFARIRCYRSWGTNARFRCVWSSGGLDSTCPTAWEETASVFWYPGMVAWVCPSIIRSCGADLSRCFVESLDSDTARNAELGTTEHFDSQAAVIKSLSKQSAGIATAIVVNNYPYTKVLEPGLTAIDGAIAHFYRQTHHFKIDDLNLSSELLSIASSMALTDTRFQLVNTGATYEHAGVLTTFGWLRRYEKNRTRANQLYERLFCRKFLAEFPAVFPQDPGNLREQEGCSGCHATLDPLADFFAVWGEGGEFYSGIGSAIETSFNGNSGSYVSDLADIIRNDSAFATCQVNHAWTYLMGRSFHTDEDSLRTALTSYFISTNYSLKELLFAIATHPAFTEGGRGNGSVDDPLAEPPLGTAPTNVERECSTPAPTYASFSSDITYCSGCHTADSNLSDLSDEAGWIANGNSAVAMMASGQMPPGNASPAILDFKESVRCWLESL